MILIIFLASFSENKIFLNPESGHRLFLDLNIIFLKARTDCPLEKRKDIASDKVNFKPNIRQTFFLKKKSGHQEFVWLLKQFGATAT